MGKILRKGVLIFRRGRRVAASVTFSGSPEENAIQTRLNRVVALTIGFSRDFREPFAVEKKAGIAAVRMTSKCVPTLLQVLTCTHLPMNTELDGLFCHSVRLGYD